MAKKKKVAKKDPVDVLYMKMGRASYMLTKAERALRQAQQVHAAAMKEAVSLANQIDVAERARK